MELERSSGILVHITSLPSAYGIGDIGPEAFKFVDFLTETKQKLWQILPITMTNSPSPYSSLSAFAGHPWLISVEKLLEAKLLSKDDLKSIDQSKFQHEYVYFKAIQTFKDQCLQIAYENFRKSNSQAKEILDKFFQQEKFWIDNFTLFLTIDEKYKEKKWCDWPESLRRRDPSALETIRQIDKDRIEYHTFVQYIFDQQWNQLKNYANQSKIKIIGDMPIYIDYHSADVWSHSHLFQLDHQDTMKPIVVASFPPDHSSMTMQNWNMPIYDWNNENVKSKIFHWWIERLRKTLSFVDILRIDHFRGLESHYVIPMDVKTDEANKSEAHWVKTPGYEFFTAVTNALGSDIPLIVEDLGDVTEEVFALRDHFKLHGVKILQMGFYYDADNMYCPHNYIPHSIAYTGTHDNPTTAQWWKKESSSKERKQFLEYIARPIEDEKEVINGYQLNKHVDKHICWYFIQLLFQSSANGAIIQMQDLLGIETRYNEPGKEADLEYDGPQNWSWRFQWSQLISDIQNRLKRLTQIYGRDMKYGKAIPPEDMIMKDNSKCLLQ